MCDYYVINALISKIIEFEIKEEIEEIIFPSKTSNPCEAERTSSGDQVLARDTLSHTWW